LCDTFQLAAPQRHLDAALTEDSVDPNSTPISVPYGPNRQIEIYLGGLAGRKPLLPVGLDKLEQRAREAMSPEAWDYIAGAAGGEGTMRANRDAFRRWRIVPRMLRDVSQRDLSIELFGRRWPAPLLLGPVGVQGIIHPDAEVAVARAASSLNIPFALSTVSSKSMEEVAAATGDATRWFQLYPSKDPELTASMVRRAEQAGYSAIVVTLDTMLLGWRERDLDYPFLPFLESKGLANYVTDPVFRSKLPATPEENPAAAVKHWVAVYSNPSFTWEELYAVRRQTRLPLLLKGILHPEDARLARKWDMDGVIVSNHGGRQVDGAMASLDALPAIVEALEGSIPVLFDSGIRRGADALKALALGARAVLLARPYLWALAVGGEQGVREVVRNFLADLDLTLALSGHCTCSELDASLLMSA
jgi:lactate 2-monooxygenase